MQNHAGVDRSVLMLLVVLPTVVVNGTDLYTGSIELKGKEFI